MSMKFAKHFSRKNIFEELQAVAKDAAIEEIVNGLKREKLIKATSAKDVVTALMKREDIGSTGIGNGVAIPHAKVPRVDDLVLALGRSAAGVDFNSIDGEPVHILFVIVSPEDDSDLHLQALKWVSGLARNKDFCRFCRAAKDPKEILALLKEMDDQSPG
ncbi:MAG: PTS sugar transporter subunit IIA [Planctomycetes bacterium]|nr:PTS sugar transporter subunit IIA [Planctomycetota bacterium]MBI3845064.1 PTS sugar transporter subunit IIA [Planctomycetota bacterium]